METKCFTPLDLEEYLNVELYHSLDRYDLRKGTLKKRNGDDSEEEGFDPRGFVSLLRRFYSFLAIVRYSVEPKYQQDTYEEFVEREYRRYIEAIDNFILNLSQVFGCGPLRDANLLEELIIYNFYDSVQCNLNIILLYRERRVVNPEDDLPNLIEERFTKKYAAIIEKSDPNHYERLLKYKQQRYDGSDRASYWRGPSEGQEHTQSFKEIRRKVEKLFSTETDSSLKELESTTVIFLLLLLTKYHITLHRYAHGAYEFRTRKQHENAEQETVKRQI